jgi:hypothetical protein
MTAGPSPWPSDWSAFLREGRRHVWSGGDRAHVEVRAPQPGSEEERLFAEAVRSLFSGRADIRWARYNAASGRVVIDGRGAVEDPRGMGDRLAELEQELASAASGTSRGFGPQRDHPADLEPLLRSLAEIAAELATLPLRRAPTRTDWQAISHRIRGALQQRIAMLERTRDLLDGFIGCGCLSLDRCRLYNPGDEAGRAGVGPRFLLGDRPRQKAQVKAR